MRKTCNAGEIAEFKFNRYVQGYRIKNFTDGAIYHTYQEAFVEDEASKVMSGFGEDTEINEFASQSSFLAVKVKVDTTGEVEVLPIKF